MKGVSASTMSPTSFASIFSGQYSTSHNVLTFADKLDPEHNALLEFSKYNTTFWEALTDKDPIYSVLGQDPTEKVHISKIEPPFIHIERENSTHSPYGYRKADSTDTSANEFIHDRIHNRKSLVESYESGVERCKDIFNSRMKTLEKRNLLDETLVIFLSDHGELLGEYAEWSHTYPMVPELVYIPGIFIHPNNKSPSRNGNEMFSHIDIVPTIYDVLDEPVPPNVQGQSIYQGHSRTRAFCELKLPKNTSPFGPGAGFFRSYNQLVNSIWDSEGGWVFNRSGIKGKCLELLYSIWLKDPTRRRAIVSNPRGWLRLLYLNLNPSQKYGNPNIKKGEARELIEGIQNKKSEKYKSEETLSDEQKRQLEDLGYL